MQAADAAGHAEDGVAAREAGDAGTRLFDDAGEIDPEHGGQRLPRMRRLSGSNLQIERIDAAGFDTNQHLARTRHGLCDLGQAEWRFGSVE